MEQQQVSADELIASLREFVGVLVQENLTYKILLGKIGSGNSPQQ
jgi:hypothetical protein